MDPAVSNIGKADRSEDDGKVGDAARAAAATAAGGAAGHGVYLSGYAGKYVNARKREAHDWTREDKARMKRHEAKHGPAGSADYFRKYPKGLPGSRLTRLMGHTHKGKLGLGVGTALDLAGAAAGYKAYEKLSGEKVVKAEDRFARAVSALEAQLSRNPSSGKRAALEKQLAALRAKQSAGVDVGAEDAARKKAQQGASQAQRPKAPSSPAPAKADWKPKTLGGWLKLGARNTRTPGYYVPAAAIAGAAGVAGAARLGRDRDGAR